MKVGLAAKANWICKFKTRARALRPSCKHVCLNLFHSSIPTPQKSKQKAAWALRFRGVLQMHWGGTLVLLHSEPGLGSTFELELPASPSDKMFRANSIEDFWQIEDVVPTSHPNRKPESLEPHQAEFATSANTPLLQGVRVLVVDDAPDNQLLVSRILKLAGANVDCAENGRRGVELALSGSYDAVLMDIQMPELDGYGATQELRAKGYTKPIIALTAHAMKDERQRCLKIGFNDHMSKPVDRAALLRKLKELALSEPLLA